MVIDINMILISKQHFIETAASNMLIGTTPFGWWVVAADDDDSSRRCGRFVGKIKPDKASVVGPSCPPCDSRGRYLQDLIPPWIRRMHIYWKQVMDRQIKTFSCAFFIPMYCLQDVERLARKFKLDEPVGNPRCRLLTQDMMLRCG